MFNKKRTCLLPVQVISVISKYELNINLHVLLAQPQKIVTLRAITFQNGCNITIPVILLAGKIKYPATAHLKRRKTKADENGDAVDRFFNSNDQEEEEEEDLKAICTHLKKKYIPDHNELDISDDLFLTCKKVIKQLNEKVLKRDQAIAKMYEKKSTVNSMECKIIDILINCMKGLPAITIHEPLGEIDLCCNYLQPVLRPIMTDFDRNIMLRWPNLKNSEAKTNDTKVNERRRPDAVASKIEQHAYGASRVFGEAKTEERRNDVGDLVRDLIRIGIFSKEAIDSSGMENMIGFQAVGNSIKFYVTALTDKKLYTMFEFAHILVPMSLSELPSFLSQADKVMQVISCIDRVYSQDKRVVESSWTATTLDSPNFKAYVYTSKGVKRPRSLIF